MSRDERNGMIDDWLMVIGYLWYLLFALLAAAVFWLIWLMKQMRDVVCVESQSAVFDREIRMLFIVLGVFSTTYLLRGVWD